MRKRENVKTPQRENSAFRELHEVHNAKAFFAFSRFRVFAFLRRELHVSIFYLRNPNFLIYVAIVNHETTEIT